MSARNHALAACPLCPTSLAARSEEKQRHLQSLKQKGCEIVDCEFSDRGSLKVQQCITVLRVLLKAWRPAMLRRRSRVRGVCSP